ncbi:MAG TPA: NAD(P)-dependent oxidoreductase [Candidatus Limnocylindrales bacterium]|jgi:phosphoglycerate dehydrogenase-like enzyme
MDDREQPGMVDRRFLAAMRPGALLVNAARGAVVDTAALLDELNAIAATPGRAWLPHSWPRTMAR